MNDIRENHKKMYILSTLVLILILSNILTHYGVPYIQENYNLGSNYELDPTGYQLNSTDYHKNIELTNFFLDQQGYTQVLLENNMNESDSFILPTTNYRRFDLDQDLQWQINVSGYNNIVNNYIGSSNDYLITCDDNCFYSDFNESDMLIKNNTNFTVYHNGVPELEYNLQFFQYPIFSIGETFDLLVSGMTEPGWIINNYFIGIERTLVNTYDVFDEFILEDPDETSVRLSLIYFDLNSLNGSRLTIVTAENPPPIHVLQISENKLQIFVYHDNSYQSFDLYELDMSLNTKYLEKINENVQLTNECDLKECDLFLLGNGNYLIKREINETAIKITLVTLKQNYTWNLSSNGVESILYQMSNFGLIIGENPSSSLLENPWLHILEFNSDSPKKIELLDYNGESYTILDIFDLKHNRTAIVIVSKTNTSFFDVQVLTNNSKNIQIDGLIGSFLFRPYVPEMLTSIFVLVVAIIVLRKTSRKAISYETYPKI